jgi:hypothetical protein
MTNKATITVMVPSNVYPMLPENGIMTGIKSDSGYDNG